jgi:hypothetical protein
MANVGYKIQSLSSNALTASVTRTVVGVKSGAAFGLQVVKWGFSFNGSAAAAGIECQLVYSTWATNAPGTNSTSITATQDYGRVLTNGITGAGHWTTEPTALTVIESKFIQQSGAYEWSVPLGKEPDCALGEGFAVRVITPAAVTPNYVAFLSVERV